jgi:serine/threonine protein kinase
MSVPPLGSIISGKYRLAQLIGEGGMGAVFAAENTVTHKRVAIKWLHPDVARRDQAAARLVREAQAAARVRHPNVVDVYDIEREGDAVFLVMEFLEGEPLTSALRRRDLRVHQMIALLLPAMRGVAEAHRQGVVHRDIKPDNIFLAREVDTRQPVPKVLDFGISKLVDPRDAEQLALTRTGSAMGTPLYMSYEQLTGAPDIDKRTDVYAFGVILYEALTGRPPFEANKFSELIVKVATQLPIHPKELRADIPTALCQLVLWAMAKDRDQRIPSMEVLIRELEPFATEHGFRAQMTLANASLPLLGSASDAAPGLRADLCSPTVVGSSSSAADVPASASSAAPAMGTQARHTLPQRRGRFKRSGAALAVFCVAFGALAAAVWHGWPAREPATVQLQSPVLPKPPSESPPASSRDADAEPELVRQPPTHVAEPPPSAVREHAGPAPVPPPKLGPSNVRRKLAAQASPRQEVPAAIQPPAAPVVETASMPAEPAAQAKPSDLGSGSEHRVYKAPLAIEF